MQVVMTCSNCGATIADRAIVCYKCGMPTAIPAAPERPAEASRGAPWWLRALVLLLIAASAAGVVLSPSRTREVLSVVVPLGSLFLLLFFMRRR